MSLGPEDVRRLALALPGAEAGAHMGKADFRVGGKIFATLHADGAVVLKFRPEQQALRVAEWPALFAPVAGGWGRQGWTRLAPGTVEAEMLQDALAAAWRNVAPKRLAKALDEAADDLPGSRST
ncbi:MmcQ/YjbR family DNA-binding protein [Paracraurococcus ruber]|uniref:MmcQ/YjbR family DNA-binding protein n=1 Tax=Paracraurococcus ruber TaxID=77675 RepID=A0ABS1CT84_9PROT|nr:MmcQ/YjbR family DNA-binding protein [Paracraurococcus ruber]MBK1657683.1 hypothetical protein [Paracraurococcus ruber]TDG31513.1 MmcQ/YjbR family DNA-binding protein [Paracraurococcus ruber]